MQLHRIYLQNFRQHAATEIELGTGITGIIGPNGSGKSTILEAIAWAFYGTPAARGSKDSIKWDRAPARSPVRVEVDFTLGAHEYRVVRGLTTAELYLDRGQHPIANHQRDVTAKVEQALGMNREEFFNTYFTGQKELAVMAAMGPAERARFLSKVLGYNRIKLAQDMLRQARNRMKGELTGLEQGLSEEAELDRELSAVRLRVRETEAHVRKLEKDKNEAEAEVGRLGPEWTRMVELREAVVNLESECRLAEQRVSDAKRDFERIDRELALAMNARSELERLAARLKEAGPLRSNLERCEREAQAAGQRRSMLGQLSELVKREEDLEKRLAERESLEQEIQKAGGRVTQLQEDLKRAQEAEEAARTAWVRDRQDAETRLAAHRAQYKDLKDHHKSLVTAGPDGECPTCTRPLGAEYDTVLKTLETQLEEIRINGEYFKQRVKQLQGEPEDLKEATRNLEKLRSELQAATEHAAMLKRRVAELAELNDELVQLRRRAAELKNQLSELPEKYDPEEHELLKRRVKELEPVLNEAARLEVQAERAEELVAAASEAETRLSGLEQTEKQLRAAVEEKGFREADFERLKTAYDAAQSRLREVELALATAKGDRKAAEAQLQSVERRVEERRERAAKARTLRGDINLHETLDSALQDLRTDLNARMRPEISEIASAFLASLTDGRYHELELDEQYQITVMEDGIPKPVISGGEEDIANLVLRLAISQMVAERAGQPLSLLVLDEIFGTLDDVRRHNVVELLRRLADRFPQVILISHIESVRDSLDHVLRVSLDHEKGIAVVTDENGGYGGEVAA